MLSGDMYPPPPSYKTNNIPFPPLHQIKKKKKKRKEKEKRKKEISNTLTNIMKNQLSINDYKRTPNQRNKKTYCRSQVTTPPDQKSKNNRCKIVKSLKAQLSSFII